MNPLFEDPVALGTAIRKARGQAAMGQGKLAKELGTSRQRLGKIERGEEGEKEPRKPEERRVLAIAVAELTGADRSLLGLSEPASDPRWQIVEKRLNFLLEGLRRLAGEQDEQDEFRQWLTSDPRSEDIDL